MTKHTFIQLCKALGQSLNMDTAWQPALKALNQDVEDVPRRATKLISNIKDKPYQEQLAIDLDLDTADAGET